MEVEINMTVKIKPHVDTRRGGGSSPISVFASKSVPLILVYRFLKFEFIFMILVVFFNYICDYVDKFYENINEICFGFLFFWFFIF